MAIRKILLSHYCKYADDIRSLAFALRLRGIVPWVDKDGGFSFADESEAEARRAIREDCFGLLLYATEDVFGREFVRDVEIDEAWKTKQTDDLYDLFAVPREISFEQAQKLSVENFPFDITKYHSCCIPSGADLQAALDEVARGMLAKRLDRDYARNPTDVLSLQFSTIQTMPDMDEDILRIDATFALPRNPGDPDNWARLLTALLDVESAVSKIYGRPCIYVHGSKHLSAAFMFGRVFSQYELDIRQTPEQVWSTRTAAADGTPLDITVVETCLGGNALSVEIASGDKNMGAGVDQVIGSGACFPAVRLQMRPVAGRVDVTEPLCKAMVRQAYSALEDTLRDRPIAEIHVFAAVPQAFMMMLGREFKGTPPTFLYEWDGSRYVQSCRIPGGRLR